MRLYAGADLGGTHFRVGLRRAGEGRLLDQVAVPADPAWDPERLVAATATLLHDLMRDHPGALAGLGFGSTGDIDPSEGVAYSMRRFPGLEAAPLGPLLLARLGVPTHLLNDGLCAGVAEMRAGAGVGVSDFVLVTLGTGIGGAVVMGGRLLTGARGRVGKVGHLIIDYDGPVCGTCHCGLRGCWQGLAGRAGLLARAGGVASSPEELARLAYTGHAVALEAFAETGRIVGVGLASLIKLLAPDRVVVGGGLAQSHPALLDAAREVVRAQAIKPYQRVPVVPAAFGTDAGLLGATLLAEHAPAPNPT